MGCAASNDQLATGSRPSKSKYKSHKADGARTPTSRTHSAPGTEPRALPRRAFPLLSEEGMLNGRRMTGGPERRPSVDTDPAAMESVSQVDAAEHTLAESCNESPGRLALQQKLVVVRALIEHGINGDADQFPPGPVQPLRPEETARVAHWVEHTAVAAFVESMSRSTSVNSGSRCTIATLPGGLDASWSISSDTTRRTESVVATSATRKVEDGEVDLFAGALAAAVFSASNPQGENNPLGAAIVARVGAMSSSGGRPSASQNEASSDSRHAGSPDSPDHGNGSPDHCPSPDLSLSGSKSPKSESLTPRTRAAVLSPGLLHAWTKIAPGTGDCNFEIGCLVTNNFPLRMTRERLNRRLDDPPKYASQFDEIVHALQLSQSTSSEPASKRIPL